MIKGVFKMAEEEWGMSREDVVARYNSDPSFRSLQGQESVLAMWRQWEAKRAIKAGRQKPKPPQVIRPGSRVDAPTHQEAALHNALRKLEDTGSVRDATRALIARRAAARRR
jgi:hypothetical protein